MAVALEVHPLLGNINYAHQNLCAILENRAEQDPHKTVRIALKIIAFGLASVAKEPFFAINLHLGPEIGPICGVGNAMGFCALATWAASKGLDSLMGPQTEIEKRMLGKGSSRCRMIVGMSLATAVAAFSETPFAFAGAEYNQNQILAATIVIVAGIALPLRSLQLSVEATHNRMRGDVAKKLLKMRSEMAGLMRSYFNERMTQGLQGRVQSIALQETSFRETTCQEMLLESINETQATPKSQSSRKIGESIGFVLNVVFQASWGFYAYCGTKKFIYDNEPFAGFLAGLSVATNMYLIGTAIQKTTGKVFQRVHDVVTKQYQRTLVEQIRPRLAFSLQALGLLIDGLGIGASIVIWSEFYDKEIPDLKIPATVFMSISTFLLLFTAMIDVVDEMTAKILLYRGTTNEKELLMLHQQMHRLADALDKTPLFNFAVFVSGLPEAKKNELLAKFKVSLIELDHYVEAGSNRYS